MLRPRRLLLGGCRALRLGVADGGVEGMDAARSGVTFVGFVFIIGTVIL